VIGGSKVFKRLFKRKLTVLERQQELINLLDQQQNKILSANNIIIKGANSK
jgi:hypothetical protein